jgi:hypothetical protein
VQAGVSGPVRVRASGKGCAKGPNQDICNDVSQTVNFVKYGKKKRESGLLKIRVILGYVYQLWAG